MKESMEAIWLEHRLDSEVQQGNALSILMAVMENSTSSLGTACSMHFVAVISPHHWRLAGVVIRAACHNLSFFLLIN